MNNIKKILFCIVLIFVPSSILYAQSFMLQIQIENNPSNKVFLGTIKGDKILLIDSSFVINGKAQFTFPENTPPGVYRLVMGQTIYARVMNRPSQYLDFIFNKENILFETDFKAPEDSLNVLLSGENKTWFRFLKSYKEIDEKLKYARMELDYYQTLKDSSNATIRANEYNQLQKSRELFIGKAVKEYPTLFASKLINMYHIPFMDGHLSQQERKEVFNAGYFKQLDFTEEALINSSVYTERVFYYFNSYAQHGLTKEQQELEFQKALDVIIAKCSKNEKVFEFILNYLVRGFEILKMDNLIAYIAQKNPVNACITDNKTTLERRLEAQKMKVGSTVHDFTLNDINDDPVRLSEVLKDNNLIIFWMSGCQHCRNMMPEIKLYLSQIRNLQFEVIAVSLDSLREEWKNGVFDLGIEGWYNLSDLKGWDGVVSSDYNIYSTPTMFIIDRNLKIIAKPNNPKDLIDFASESSK
jgi:peroxiredoxin